MCWCVIPEDSIPRGGHSRQELLANWESSTPGRPPLAVLLQLCLYTGWFSPQRFSGANRLSQRNSLKRGTKLHYCGELLQCKEPCQTIHHHSGIFSWGLLPPIAGQSHVANTCRLLQAWRVFSTIFTQLFTLNYSLLTFVHTAAVLGSYPAIQQ